VLEEDIKLKIILMEDIPALGPMGAVVDVTRGYARNFLIPQGKAREATTANMVDVEKAKARYAQQKISEKEAAIAEMSRLEGMVVTIAQRVGEGEKLYGSVTAMMIADQVAAQGYELDKKQLDLPEPLKKLGTYQISVRLAPEVKATITVEVVPENA
jgi:large subunit ribosomal protein L9